jgi:hypothetical protein
MGHPALVVKDHSGLKCVECPRPQLRNAPYAANQRSGFACSANQSAFVTSTPATILPDSTPMSLVLSPAQKSNNSKKTDRRRDSFLSLFWSCSCFCYSSGCGVSQATEIQKLGSFPLRFLIHPMHFLVDLREPLGQIGTLPNSETTGHPISRRVCAEGM